MENIRVFLDTDVLINWLTKEEDPNTGKTLWKAPYKILKMIENEKLSGTTTLINLMEILFVLRRKKKWKDELIVKSIGEINSMANFNILVPTEGDMVLAYNLQIVLKLDPFDSIYYAIAKRSGDFIITRDSDFIRQVNFAEKKMFALKPEEFLTL